jgi:ABC-type molybdate transport system substrate-binding protein
MAQAEELRVLAAGSLREVMDEIGDRYKTATGIGVTYDFGPSGVLRERIEKGEKALSSGKIDVMIGYCSGRQRMLSAISDLQVVEVPTEIAASPEYGLAILKGADLHAEDLALYMLSPEGQGIFAKYGFAPVSLPAPAP